MCYQCLARYLDCMKRISLVSTRACPNNPINQQTTCIKSLIAEDLSVCQLLTRAKMAETGEDMTTERLGLGVLHRAFASWRWWCVIVTRYYAHWCSSESPWRWCVPMPDVFVSTGGVRCADVIRREVRCSRQTRPQNGKLQMANAPDVMCQNPRICFLPGPRTSIAVFNGIRFWILKEWRPAAAQLWFDQPYDVIFVMAESTRWHIAHVS